MVSRPSQNAEPIGEKIPKNRELKVFSYIVDQIRLRTFVFQISRLYLCFIYDLLVYLHHYSFLLRANGHGQND